jgi:hypothetical protein
MKQYLIIGAVVLALAVGVFGGSAGEFTWRKVTGPGPNHVDVVTGHDKRCYVFVKENKETDVPVLLWCEPATERQ